MTKFAILPLPLETKLLCSGCKPIDAPKLELLEWNVEIYSFVNISYNYKTIMIKWDWIEIRTCIITNKQSSTLM